MRARLYKDRIGQGRRQRRDIVDVSRIPTRQHRKPRADRGIRKKLLVEDTLQTRNRGLIDAEMLPSSAAFTVYSQAVSSDVGNRIWPGSAAPIASSRSRKRWLSLSGGAE